MKTMTLFLDEVIVGEYDFPRYPTPYLIEFASEILQREGDVFIRNFYFQKMDENSIFFRSFAESEK
jgi:hypothetical protein